MKQLKQLSLFVENRPGALSEVCRVLKDAGVKTRAKWLALHHPVIHFGYQSMRKILKRG